MTATTIHVPVLLAETLAILSPRSGGRYIDGTIGGGGHGEAILEASGPDGRLLGLDLDRDAIERARARLDRFADRVVLTHSSFTAIERVARWEGFAPVEGVVLDLGLSSDQLDSAKRGYSFQADGPLDMRFDHHGHGPSARTLLNTLTAAKLADILFRYGEEPRARAIARNIVESRARQPIASTGDLVNIVLQVTGRQRGRTHPATKTFQALRIAVNQELDALQAALPQAIEILAVGGRLAVITFHSLEDRLVKHYFRDMSATCVCPPGLPVCICGAQPRVRLVTRHGIKPTTTEVARNSRSRSATLRAVERLADPVSAGSRAR